VTVNTIAECPRTDCYVYVKLKDRKRSLSRKNDQTRCGIRETATTRNFVLWLFLKKTTALVRLV